MSVLKRLIMLMLVSAIASAEAASYAVDATAYSLTGITATGKQVKVGHVALSRDLLKSIPYGSLVRVVPYAGPNCNGRTTGVLIVEDTMASYIKNTVDIKVASYKNAIAWGRCKSMIHVVRYGR